MGDEPQPELGDLLRRAERPGVVPPLPGDRLRIRRLGGQLDPDLAIGAEEPVLLAERDPSPAREVEHRGRQRPAARMAIEDEDGRVRGERFGRPGHVDGGVVEVDRILAVAEPGPGGPEDEQTRDERCDEEAEDGVDLACPGQLGGVGGRGDGIDLLERGEDGSVEVAVAEERQHVLLVDPLAAGIVQELRLEPGARVELDLAVLATGVHVEEDHQPVVEALPADAPLVHQGPRVGLGLVRRPAVLDVLGVDDHLGPGPRLDPIDELLGLLLGGGGQDVRRVVDANAVLGRRERGPGRVDDSAEDEERQEREGRPGERGRPDGGRESTHGHSLAVSPVRRSLRAGGRAPARRRCAG